MKGEILERVMACPVAVPPSNGVPGVRGISFCHWAAAEGLAVRWTRGSEWHVVVKVVGRVSYDRRLLALISGLFIFSYAVSQRHLVKNGKTRRA